MAIFYDYIKGCKAGTTDKNSGNWSWIEWTNAQPPIIYTNTSATKPNTSWGNILTTGGSEQFVDKPLTMLNILKFKRSNNANYFSLSMDNYSSEQCYFKYNNTTLALFKSTGIEISTPIQISYDATFTTNAEFRGSVSLTHTGSPLTINSYCKIGANASTDSDDKRGSIYIEKKCQALYFNSTSDARAKKDIQPLFTSVLDVIKSLQVYRFSYKADESHEPVIGLLAQEANQFEIEDFSLVSNAAASGENGDYMSIKESKLVYILWKAIQEQQEQIEALQAEIKELKK